MASRYYAQEQAQKKPIFLCPTEQPTWRIRTGKIKQDSFVFYTTGLHIDDNQPSVRSVCAKKYWHVMQRAEHLHLLRQSGGTKIDLLTQNGKCFG